MALFQKSKNSFTGIDEVPFKLEREIQNLFEENLESILNLELVKSEFTIKNKRIDTLAYDKASNAFIIIEYKRSKNSSVIDQGFSYLGLMLENKADFILEYNENKKGALKRNEVEWSQSRVIFVSQSFNDVQISAANYKDLAIELWEVKRYENFLISINQIKTSKTAESVKPITSNSNEMRAVQEEIKVYSEDDHLTGKSDTILELYEDYKNAILNLSDDIEVEAKKMYIAFKKDKNIVDISIQNKQIKLHINLKKGELDNHDILGLARDMSKVGHWGNGDYEITVKDTENLEYIKSLVKQAI
jgi:predicted transport protein